MLNFECKENKDLRQLVAEVIEKCILSQLNDWV